MASLEDAARETTPLLADLRLAAPDLNTLAENLPAFARATERSLVTLGQAAKPGIQALRQGDDEIRSLAEAAGNTPPVAQQTKLFLDDLADPRRAVSIDARVPEVTGRDNPEPGQPDTQGYTGMEGLLNYFYYFGGALNQFDDVGHFLHFSLYDVFAGPCGEWNAQQNWPLAPGASQTPGVDDGLPAGRTRDPLKADPCVGFLGPNQPGITPGSDESDLGVGRYDGSVCPNGSSDPEICSPGQPAEFPDNSLKSPVRATNPAGGGGGGDTGDAPSPEGPAVPGVPDDPDEVRDQLEDLLDLPNKALDDLGLGGGGKDGKKNLNDTLGGVTNDTNQAAQDLLDFLFAP
jgi:hypothetical protein